MQFGVSPRIAWCKIEDRVYSLHWRWFSISFFPLLFIYLCVHFLFLPCFISSFVFLNYFLFALLGGRRLLTVSPCPPYVPPTDHCVRRRVFFIPCYLFHVCHWRLNSSFASFSWSKSSALDNAWPFSLHFIFCGVWTHGGPTECGCGHRTCCKCSWTCFLEVLMWRGFKTS